MSTPRTLDIPVGVDVAHIETERLTFAVHRAHVENPKAHVLLVPGWTGGKEDFTPLLPLLAAAGYDATGCDQRGQYETPGDPGADYSLDGLAADITALARALGPGPTHLLGHSFGGLVCQHAAINAPAQWASLSLLCTGPSALGTSDDQPLHLLYDALGSFDLGTIYDFREQMSGGSSKPAEIAAFLRTRFTSNSVESLKAMTGHLMYAPDRLDDVIASGVPTWVGWGADDDAWPLDTQARMAERLDVTAHVIEEAGHSPAVDNPKGLVEAWVPFLDAHS